VEKVVTEREFHEIAKLFPMMSPDDFDSLKADIKENGQRELICVHPDDGSIIDGRNRYVACRELDIEPECYEWDGNGSLVSFVVSLNLHRRHLTQSQRATVGTDIEAELAKENPPGRPKRGEEKGGTNATKNRDTAGQLVGVSPRYIQEAKKLKEDDPDAFERVRAGEQTLTDVKRQKKEERKAERRAEAAEAVADLPPTEQLLGNAKFSTIVIDPPWDFRDEGDVDVYGRTRPDYHQMPFADILGIPISDYADEDCHLYLWITNRSMYKGFDLLERWAFRFITILTWCKPSIGVGNYFRNNTEHVLFGVKGSQLLKRNDVPTWFEAKRGPRGHSSKPLEFLDLVESCSHGPYLEWFARPEKDEERPGWKYLNGVEPDN